jgi:predicted transcriptional regulator YheO
MTNNEEVKTKDKRIEELRGLTHISISKAMQMGDLNDIADNILDEIVRRIKQTTPLNNYKEVALIVKSLDEKGFFELRESVNKTAKALRVSRVTVYNHLNAKYGK